MLPQVKYPLYETTMPSSGKKVKYRPYNTAEEKTLLMAVESGDPEQFKLALKQIVTNCIQECPDVDTMPTFDIEFLYLKLRAASVSDTLDLQVKLFDCPQKTEQRAVCDTPIRISINMADVCLMAPKKDADGAVVEAKFESSSYRATHMVKLSDTLGVQLRYPSYNDFDIIKTMMNPDVDEDSIGFELLARCTVTVFDAESVFQAADSTLEEMIAWYRQLTKKQLSELDWFFKSIPQLVHTQPVTCKKCGKTTDYTIRGISSFFQ